MQVREIELIQSSIDNGRIYFPISDVTFFPTDSLSDRELEGHKGTDVLFLAGKHRYVGPIRVSSGRRLSPQRSFAQFLTEFGAIAGDKLVVTRNSEREYEVKHMPSR